MFHLAQPTASIKIYELNYIAVKWIQFTKMKVTINKEKITFKRFENFIFNLEFLFLVWAKRNRWLSNQGRADISNHPLWWYGKLSNITWLGKMGKCITPLSQTRLHIQPTNKTDKWLSQIYEFYITKYCFLILWNVTKKPSPQVLWNVPSRTITNIIILYFS